MATGHKSHQQQPRPVDPSDLGSTQEAGFVGPDHWTYAQLKDWILLCPDIPHTDVRVYGILRSLATRWLNDQRVTKDRLRWMCPGTNGKPMSERTFDEVLRRLGQRELVMIVKGSINVRSARHARTGRFERVEEMLIRVNELPPEGLDYAGWHNVRDVFDAYPGPGWDREQPTEENRRSHRARKTADGADQAKPADRQRKTAPTPARSEQGKLDVSAGHTGDTPAQNFAEPPQFFAERNAATSENPPPQTSVPDVSYSIDRASESPSASEPAAPAPTDTARELVRALHYGRHLPPSAADVDQVAGLVDAAIEQGLTPAEVRAYCQAAIRRCHSSVVPYLVGALDTDRLPVPRQPVTATGTPAVPPVCGQCNARAGDPVTARVVWLDNDWTRSERCPRCHPWADAGVLRSVAGGS